MKARFLQETLPCNNYFKNSQKIIAIRIYVLKKDGVILASPDGSCELTVSGINNVFNDSVNVYYEKYGKTSGDLVYEKIESNWYVCSWVDGDKIVYKKVVVGSGSVNLFVIKYPLKQKEIYDPIINRLISTFKTPEIDSMYGTFYYII